MCVCVCVSMLLFVFPECVRERQKVNADLRGNRPRVCTFAQVQLAVFRGRCWGRLLHEQVDLTSTSHTHTNTHTHVIPPSPPDPAALIITVATPIDVPRHTERVCGRPSAGLLHRDCGKSDLWCLWCCWPQTLTLTPLYSLFAFLPPSFFVCSSCVSFTLGVGFLCFHSHLKVPKPFLSARIVAKTPWACRPTYTIMLLLPIVTGCRAGELQRSRGEIEKALLRGIESCEMDEERGKMIPFHWDLWRRWKKGWI